MRVRCIRDQPDGEALRRMGRAFFDGRGSPLTVGRDYLVYGIAFHNGGVWFHVLNATGSWLFDAPIELFEVLDPRVSRHWRLGQRDDRVLLYPELLLGDYLHDDLSEGVPDVVRRVRELTTVMEAEMAEPSGEPQG